MSIMSNLTDDMPTRSSVATLISVALHGAVIAGLLYASASQTLNLPTPEQSINVELVAPEVQPQAAAQSQPQPPAPMTPAVSQPDITPPTVEEPPVSHPVEIEKPKPKPKLKPVHKPTPQPVPRPKTVQVNR